MLVPKHAQGGEAATTERLCLLKSCKLRQTVHPHAQILIQPDALNYRFATSGEIHQPFALHASLLVAGQQGVDEAEQIVVGNEYIRDFNAALARGYRKVVILQRDIAEAQRGMVDRGRMRVEPHALDDIV